MGASIRARREQTWLAASIHKVRRVSFLHRTVFKIYALSLRALASALPEFGIAKKLAEGLEELSMLAPSRPLVRLHTFAQPQSALLAPCSTRRFRCLQPSTHPA